ncbi:hypothetical protein LSO12E_80005 [Candidatus Liberibacter solanacearum]
MPKLKKAFSAGNNYLQRKIKTYLTKNRKIIVQARIATL